MSDVKVPFEVGLEPLTDLKEPLSVEDLRSTLTATALTVADKYAKDFWRRGTATNHGVKLLYESSGRSNITQPFEFVHQKLDKAQTFYPIHSLGKVMVARLIDRSTAHYGWFPGGPSLYLPEPPAIAFTSGKYYDLWANFNPGTADLDVERTTVRVVEPESPAAQVLAHIAGGLEQGISELFKPIADDQC